ncbi:MAG: dephospho-CoA kinase [Bacteroidota bacterium]
MLKSSKPVLVGITGGIGSGKSVVCRIFECLNVPVYYADDRAKWLMRNNESLIKSIKENFGEQSYQDGLLNTAYLASTVFPDQERLNQLNGLVHPAVAKDNKEWIDYHKGQPLLIKEAALLFETGSYKSLDCIITVAADQDTRISRVLSRDAHRSEEEVLQIIDKQMPQSRKIELADFVIHNNPQDELIQQVFEFLNQKQIVLN